MRSFRVYATPVVLVILVILLVWGASWGWMNLTAPLPTEEPTPCVTKKAVVVTPAQVTVRVFNGGFTTGLAGRVGKYLSSHGYKVSRVTNTEERVAETIVRGNKKDQAALDLVKSEFKSSVIQYDDRVDGTVDVLVGTTYDGIEKAPLKEVKTPGGVVCEPVAPASSSTSPEAQTSSQPSPSATKTN